MTDAGALFAELDDLRRQRESLRARVDARGRRRRHDIEELRTLTRRELTIEARLLPRVASATDASDVDEGHELAWWQK